MNTRAAVIIGVSTSAGLPKLTSAGPCARDIGSWLESSDPGYDVKVITDEDGPVKRQHIFEVISDFLIPTRYELLLVHYIGHGLYKERSDIWMLSGMQLDPAECINLAASRDYAKFCGVKNVVFISDACRSLPQSVGMTNATGVTVFPNLTNVTKTSSKIDYFCATAEGYPAYEGEIDGTRQPYLTYALRSAYRTPSASMVREMDLNGRPVRVVPNRELEEFLQNMIDEKLGEEDFTKTQCIEASVPSRDDVFIAPVDPQPLTAGESVDGEAVLAPDKITLDDPKQGVGGFVGGIVGVVRGPGPVAPVTKVLTAARGPVKTGAGPRPRPHKPKPTCGPNELFRQWMNSPDADPGDLSPVLSKDLRLCLPDPRVTSFESQTGFTVTGAQVRRVAATGHPAADASAEIAHGKIEEDDLTAIRFHPRASLGEVVIELDDGRSLFLPALTGYIGHILIGKDGMSALSYIPSETNWRSHMMPDERNRVDRLRAAAAVAMDRNQFRVGDAENAQGLAHTIRMGKSVDPTLGLYAAYAYSEAGEDAQILDISKYMHMDIGGDLFDVRLLSHRAWQDIDGFDVSPRCPLLTQGWNIVESRQAPLPQPLQDCRPFLTNALWSTFGPGAADILFTAISKGDL